MAYRKRTLRRMPPISRDFAKLIGEAQSALNRMKTRVLPSLLKLEDDARWEQRNLERESIRVGQAPGEQTPLFPESEEVPAESPVSQAEMNGGKL